MFAVLKLVFKTPQLTRHHDVSRDWRSGASATYVNRASHRQARGAGAGAAAVPVRSRSSSCSRTGGCLGNCPCRHHDIMSGRLRTEALISAYTIGRVPSNSERPLRRAHSRFPLAREPPSLTLRWHFIESVPFLENQVSSIIAEGLTRP